jgi:leader peptidase (prepilin peptidase)/N-methyltransferase
MILNIVYIFILLVIAIIDFKYYIISNKLIYPAILLAFALSYWTDTGIVNALIGASVGAVILSIPFLCTGGKGIGLGDIELIVFIGLITGFPGVLFVILIGFMLGGIVAVVLLFAHIKRDKIPFGPFLSIASIIILLWGSKIYEMAIDKFTDICFILY